MTRISMFITDFDRTITDRSMRVDEECLAEISALRDRGVHTTLVTGRERAFVDHFLTRHLGVFDSVVCENGCIVRMNGEWHGAAEFRQRRRIVSRFIQSGTEFDRGECIISTETLSEEEVRRLLSGIPGWHAIVNVNSIMILPRGIDKGLGIKWLQTRKGFSKGETAAIGDGENDLIMREYSALFGAPASAVESVRRVADYVSRESYGAGTRDFIRYLQETHLVPARRNGR